MPKLKFKNGSTWTELSVGGGDLADYPVGSFYFSPTSFYIVSGIYSTPPTSDQEPLTGWTYDLKKESSPAAKLGGTWKSVDMSLNQTNWDVTSYVPNLYTTQLIQQEGLSYTEVLLYQIVTRNSGSSKFLATYGRMRGFTDASSKPVEQTGFHFDKAPTDTAYAKCGAFCNRIWQRIA